MEVEWAAAAWDSWRLEGNVEKGPTVTHQPQKLACGLCDNCFSFLYSIWFQKPGLFPFLRRAGFNLKPVTQDYENSLTALTALAPGSTVGRGVV